MRPGVAGGFWPEWRHLFTDTFARHVDTLLRRVRAGEIDFSGGGDYGLPTDAEA